MSQLVLDLTPLLGSAQSPDAAVRNAAEQQLQQLQKEQYPAFLLSLATELASDSKPVDSRRLAGLVLKNALDARDDARRVRATRDGFDIVGPGVACVLHAARRHCRDPCEAILRPPRGSAVGASRDPARRGDWPFDRRVFP